MKLLEIAERLDCKLEGDGSINISGVATLGDALEGDLSFLTNPKYFNEVKTTKASAIITGHESISLGIAMLRHDNPYLVFAKAIELFHAPLRKQPFIHPTAWIADTAKVGKRVSIGAYTYIADGVSIEDEVEIHAHCVVHEGVHIGEGSILNSGCIVREDVRIGKRCIIQNNAVIGSDGFGYAKKSDGSWYKIYQAGKVIIGDDVEIGACTTVDRSTLGETRISDGAKLDNLVQIGHGSSVGANSLLCAQVGLAGSSKIGMNVVLAGQVGISGHLTIGDGSVVTAQSGIPRSLEPGSIASGSPAIDNKQWLKSTAVFAKLPEVQKALRNLEKRVARLEATSDVTLQEVTT